MPDERIKWAYIEDLGQGKPFSIKMGGQMWTPRETEVAKRLWIKSIKQAQATAYRERTEQIKAEKKELIQEREQLKSELRSILEPQSVAAILEGDVDA